MYNVVLLNTGLSLEFITQGAKMYGQVVLDGLEAKLEAYDKAHPVVEPCTGNLICTRENVRHKAGCMGRTLPIEAYARGLHEA